MSGKGEISLSFLDLLSCALGALILLFLIFSTFHHQGLSRPTTGKKPPLPAGSLSAAKTPLEGHASDQIPQLWELHVLFEGDSGDVKTGVEGEHLYFRPHDIDPTQRYLVFVEKPVTAAAQKIVLSAAAGTGRFATLLQELQPRSRQIESRFFTKMTCTFDPHDGWIIRGGDR